jgi:hypothetical protein
LRFTMTLRRLALMLTLLMVFVGAPPVLAEDDYDAARLPGGINPADIDSRCSIMAGRLDRAYLNCSAFGQQEFRTPAVQFLIDNPPPGRGPLQIYSEEEARARGLGPYRRR